MTQAIDLDVPDAPAVPATRSPRALRSVFAVNAVTSLVTGAAGVVAASWWADELGFDSTAAIGLVSASLVVFALGVGVASRRPERQLGAVAVAISAVDLAWVLGTVVVLATVDLTTFGRVVAVVLGAGVLGFAVLQLWLRPRRR